MGTVLPFYPGRCFADPSQPVDNRNGLCYIFYSIGCDEDTSIAQAAQREIHFGARILLCHARLTTSEPSAQIVDRVRPLPRQ